MDAMTTPNRPTPRTITRGEFLHAGAAALALGASCAALPRTPPPRPNFVIFIADDHDLFYTGCYGNRVVRTPNIDRIAGEGLRFDNAYTATAMCAPSRSMLYTGLFPHRNGAHPNHSSIRDGIDTLPFYLGALGYRVALAGKRHIKPESAFSFEYIEQDAVDSFLDDAGNAPFCLIVASKQPHTPHETGGYTPDEVPLHPALVDTPATRQRVADYCTDIDLLDAELGTALDALESRDLLDSSLFIYTSDHGAPLPFAKWTCYESGLRVPFIVRWPGYVEPGTTTSAMIEFVDVLPTFIELAGGRTPRDLDGQSFASVLSGKSATHRSAVYGTHTSEGMNNGGFYPIRSVRIGNLKYILNLNPDGAFTNNITEGSELFGDLWGSWQELAKTDARARDRVTFYQHRPLEELYDLDADPYELRNLANDATFESQLAPLRRRLLAWMRAQNDPHYARGKAHFAVD
jgi:uncharacterized sulfatase